MADVKAWLGKHARFNLGFRPTSSSRLIRVEQLFAAITGKNIWRGSSQILALPELVIEDHLDRHNARAKPHF